VEQRRHRLPVFVGQLVPVAELDAGLVQAEPQPGEGVALADEEPLHPQAHLFGAPRGRRRPEVPPVSWKNSSRNRPTSARTRTRSEREQWSSSESASRRPALSRLPASSSR